MEFYKQIAFFMMVFTGLSVAVDPDWSCDFEEDECGIIQGEGNWHIDPAYRGELSANFLNNSPGEMAVFSIPYNYTSPHGNLSFEYFNAGYGSVLTVKTCKELNESNFEVYAQRRPDLENVVLPYSCTSIIDVEIKFIATRDTIAPLITVDNILIYEDRIIDEPTGSVATAVSSEANVSDVTRSHFTLPTLMTASLNTERGSDPLGTIAVSVISSVTTAFVICCLVITIVLCRRFLRLKTNSSDSNHQAITLGNRQTVQVEFGAQRNNPAHGTKSIPVNTPKQGVITSTEHYMSLVDCDQPHLYSQMNPTNSWMLSCNEEGDIAGDGYEIPFTPSEIRVEPNQGTAFNHVYSNGSMGMIGAEGQEEYENIKSGGGSKGRIHVLR